jgi:hypothetical protein
MTKLDDADAFAAELAPTALVAPPSPTSRPPQAMLVAAIVTSLLCLSKLLIVLSLSFRRKIKDRRISI